MNTKEIAERLRDLLKQGQFEQAQKELFASDVTSVEPATAGIPEVKGIEAILEKGAQFRASVEAWHGITVGEPIISNTHFAITLKVELTFKGQEPSTMDELIVYRVADGKIDHEQFYY